VDHQGLAEAQAAQDLLARLELVAAQAPAAHQALADQVVVQALLGLLAQAELQALAELQDHPVLLDRQDHLVVLEDLTQMRQLEFAVRQSEKLAAVGQLAAGIAHEIRNPLAGISGSIELLSAQAQTEDDVKLKKIILKEIDRLNRLISEFLDFAKPEKIPTDLINVGAILKETLQAIAHDPSAPVGLQVEMDIQDVPQVRGNVDKLKQAFYNILINSLQAMQSSKSAILKVRCRQLNNVVDVSFVDSGIGMSEATLKRMFEPFMTTKSKGTGLGLAITHKILEMHQALVFVESRVNQGTEIHIHFPLIEN
jgi:two-component system sensor histidine kinase PilS (NtrC family)